MKKAIYCRKNIQLNSYQLKIVSSSNTIKETILKVGGKQNLMGLVEGIYK